MKLINISLAVVFTASLAAGAFANGNDQKHESAPSHQDAPRSAPSAPRQSPPVQASRPSNPAPAQTFRQNSPAPRQSNPAPAQTFRPSNPAPSNNRGWWNGNSSQQNHPVNTGNTNNGNSGYHHQDNGNQTVNHGTTNNGQNTFGNGHQDHNQGNGNQTANHGTTNNGQNAFGNGHQDHNQGNSTTNNGQNTFGNRHQDHSNDDQKNKGQGQQTGQNTFGNRHQDNGTTGYGSNHQGHTSNGSQSTNTFQRRQDAQNSGGWWQGNNTSQNNQGSNQRNFGDHGIQTQHSDAFPHSTGMSFNFTHNVDGMHNRYSQDSSRHQVQVQHFFGKHTQNWRYGYFQKEGFNQSRFHTSLYVFSPFEQTCVVSPWYSYPTLPAYLPTSEVVIDNNVACNWNEGALYFYYPNQRYDSYGIAPLNSAISDITQIFQNADANAINDLIPSQDQIAIYQEGRYMYSVEGADFQKMMQDNADNTQTTAFQITSVKVLDAEAIVTCRHTFDDPQNGSDTVYQEYRLRNDDGRYVVTDFMTSHSPILNYHF
jgi:hypothetical protein